MSLRKYATFEVLSKTLVPKNASKATLRRMAHRAEFNYEPRPGFLYVRSRAISSRCNDNFDEFPAEEIKKAYATFIGKPVFVNHVNDNHRRARGVIIDAALHEDHNPDGSPDTWAEVLMEVDAVRFPKLAQAILAGHIDRTSMGTDVAYSICSACNNKATSPAEYCQHIPRMKGTRIYRATASGKKEGVLIREKCFGLGFFENSLLVEEPADPTAYFLGVDDRGMKATASKVSAKDASLAAVVAEDARKTAMEIPLGDDDRAFYQQMHEQGQRDAEMREHAQQRPVNLADPADLKAHLFETHGWDENDLWRNSHPADHPAMMAATDEDRPLTHTELRDAHEHEHNVEFPDEYQGAVTLGDSHFHTASKTAAGPMGTPRRGDGRHKHRVTSHCRVCGSDIYLVNGTNWQHDIDSGAGLPHQAVPADDPDEDDDAATGEATSTTAKVARLRARMAQEQSTCPECATPMRANRMIYHPNGSGEPVMAAQCPGCAKPFYATHSGGWERLAARRVLAYGETFAPADVDTLRDEECPVCGERDSYDGNSCQVCGFDAPPQMFQDPDLEKAKSLDLRKDVLQDAGTMPGQDGLTPEEQDANGGLPGEVPGEGVPGSDEVPVDPSMVTEDGEVTPTTDPEQILQMQMEQLQSGVPLTPDQLGPNGEIGVGDPGLDPEADVDAATGHVNQGGEAFTPGPNAPQQPGEPEGPVSPEDLDADGEPTDGQQVNPAAGEGVPGTPEDGVPDLQCPACGFTADAAQPMSTNMDDPMAPNTDGGGMAAGDVCPNCQKALLISPGEAEQMQGGVPVQAARRQADLDPSQFETPIRPRMQDYLNHPYAWPDVAEKMHSSPAARDDWQSLWKAKDKHEKAAFVAYSAGNHDKEQMHLDAALTAHRASNEARLAVEYPRDEHPLFGRGGPLEGVPPEEWDERMGLK